jgi:hypothetical protein
LPTDQIDFRHQTRVLQQDWSDEEARDALAYVYFEDEPGR